MAKTLTIYMLLGLLVVFGTGCSGKKTVAKSFAPPPPAIVDPRDDESPDNHDGGETVYFEFENSSVLQEYTGRGISKQDIKDVKINFDFADVDESDVSLYWGEVRIGYTEKVRDPETGEVTGTKERQAKFWSSNSQFAENRVFDSQYNRFYVYNNKSLFKAFVQDSAGALIVKFSEETNDLNTWSGFVYFKNFNYNICGDHWPYFCNEQPMRFGNTLHTVIHDGSTLPCWFITAGPYQCGAFMNITMNGQTVKMPEETLNGYKLLGRFENVDLVNALNIEE